MDPVERALGFMADGRVANTLLDFLDQELDRRTRAVDSRVFALLAREGPLDAQAAVQAWLEKKAIRDLRLSLERKTRAGQTAGETLNEHGRLALTRHEDL